MDFETGERRLREMQKAARDGGSSLDIQAGVQRVAERSDGVVPSMSCGDPLAATGK